MVFDHAHCGHHYDVKFVSSYLRKHFVDTKDQLFLKSADGQVKVKHVDEREQAEHYGYSPE